MAVQNQIAKVENFKSLINTKDMFGRMSAACGTKEAAKQFMASMLDLFEGDAYLQNCNPSLVVNECIKAASLNLPLVKSLGYAYVVPYKNKRGELIPTFIIGYKGMIQLALRSGQYRRLNADCIYEGETFTRDRLSGNLKITGEPTSDKAVAYFAYFELVNGFEKTLVMTVDEITAYAKKYSRAFDNGPWKTDFDAMAKKTVLRRIFTYGPMSTEMQEVEAAEVRAAEAAARAEIDEKAGRTVIDLPEEAYAEQEAQNAMQEPVPAQEPAPAQEAEASRAATSDRKGRAQDPQAMPQPAPQEPQQQRLPGF